MTTTPEYQCTTKPSLSVLQNCWCLLGRRYIKASRRHHGNQKKASISAQLIRIPANKYLNMYPSFCSKRQANTNSPLLVKLYAAI
uniref:Uncharacterized protein n=1 Tax=Arundo donax TaxID=35708 RepID=A0A0A9EBZ2_ARUDO